MVTPHLLFNLSINFCISGGNVLPSDFVGFSLSVFKSSDDIILSRLDEWSQCQASLASGLKLNLEAFLDNQLCTAPPFLQFFTSTALPLP